MKHCIISDLHLGRGDDNLDRREGKSQAAENIAAFLQNAQEEISLILNGDIFHRPDGYMPNPHESFQEKIARQQAGPLGEVLRQGNHRITYLPGNCDRWAMGDEESRAKLCALLGVEQEGVHFPGLVHCEEKTLITHGHVLMPPLSMIRDRFLLRSTRKQAARLGARMPEALLPSDAFVRQLEKSDERGGAHNWLYRGKRLVFDTMLALPGMGKMRHNLQGKARRLWDSCYREALLHGGSTWVELGVRTLVMGHTHLPSVHARDDLQKEFGDTLVHPDFMVNSGSAGADATEDGSGTFAVLPEEEAPRLYYSFHPDSPAKASPVA